jgi:endonuclease YncB( thermonuclease family)
MRKPNLLLLILIVLLAFSQVAYTQSIHVVIDDVTVLFSASSGEPYIDSNSRTLVPFRIVLEQFGCDVDWNQADQIAIAGKDNIVVQVPIGKSYIYVNGAQKPNDTSAQIKNGRTYLPIRAVLEAFGASVAWNPFSNSVIVDSTGASIAIINPIFEKMQKARIDHTIDGDTFVLESGEKVRMIGIDSPEVTGPYTKAEFYGEQASAYAKEVLTGTTVYLDKDVSDKDQYSRLLRYVYLEDGTFFNLLLIEEGYAEAVQWPPDLKYTEVFEAAEDKAQKSKMGLWSN